MQNLITSVSFYFLFQKIEDIKRGRDTPLEQSPRANAKKPKQQQRRRRAAKMVNGQVCNPSIHKYYIQLLFQFIIIDYH